MEAPLTSDHLLYYSLSTYASTHNHGSSKITQIRGTRYRSYGKSHPLTVRLFMTSRADNQGARHAQNVAYRTPRAELLSICDPWTDILESMRSKLPPSVKQFKSADECLDQKGLEAVLIASETSLHAELAKKAMDRGLVCLSR